MVPNSERHATAQPFPVKYPLRKTAMAAAVAAALALGVVGLPQKSANAAPTPPVTVLRAAALPGSFADMAERVRPAVVFIEVEKFARRLEGSEIPPQMREFMERYFQGQVPGTNQMPSRGVGSGFIISADGYIVTNNHVVAGADKVTVRLSDGTSVTAAVRGTDPKTDLALLKIEGARAFPFVEFGDSDRARVGDWVVAVGSPFGLGGTFSAGIVSARGRDIHSGPYDDFIQTDASINQGNSGGPLFNTEGQVVGVNTAIFSPSGGNVGIGFAVPSALAKPVLEQLKQDGRVARGWLGVRVQTVTKELAEAMNLPSHQGALIAEVQPQSPAAEGGLKVGDVVRTIDGAELEDAGDLSRAVGSHSPTDKLTIGVWREDSQRELVVQLAPTPGDEVVAASSPAPQEEQPKARLGIQVADLTPSVREQLGLAPDAVGAVIVNVVPGSPASRRGLRPGDVVLRVGSASVVDAAALVRLVRAEKGDQLVLLVSRKGATQFVPVNTGRG